MRRHDHLLHRRNKMNTTEMLERTIQRIPYPSQISQLEFERAAIRFTWRGHRFRVSESMIVETVGNGVLIGDNASILLQELLKP